MDWAVSPHWRVPLPKMSMPSGKLRVMRSMASEVAGVASAQRWMAGVEEVETAPAVLMRRVKTVVWAVAVALPVQRRVMAVMRKVLPEGGVKEVPVEVDEVPRDSVRVMAVSVLVAPAAAAPLV